MEHLKVKLEKVQAQIDVAITQLGNETNSENAKALRDFIVVLGEDRRIIRAEMEALTPTPPAPAPAPASAQPGNSITLPQVLPPFFHRLFPPVFLLLEVASSTITIKL